MTRCAVKPDQVCGFKYADRQESMEESIGKGKAFEGVGRQGQRGGMLAD